MSDDKLTIQLAYLKNSWDKIQYFKNRQWATLISYSAISLVLLSSETLKKAMIEDAWKAFFIVVIYPLASFISILFCFHLRHKITRERCVIKAFEKTYEDATTEIRKIRESDVTSHDFGDKLVYGTYITFVLVLMVFVMHQYAKALIVAPMPIGNVATGHLTDVREMK